MRSGRSVKRGFFDKVKIPFIVKYILIQSQRFLCRRIMGVNYNKMWELLIDKRITRSTLGVMAGLSSVTIARFGNDENVSTATLVKICKVLECDVSDIMEEEYLKDSVSDKRI